MRILYIVNPTANSGKAKSAIERIEERMNGSVAHYEIQTTTEPGDATIIAKENAALYDVICAVGGDGTIREVAIGLIEANAGSLGIIAAGTGNDIAKGMGWDKDFDQAIDRILKGNQKKIDVGWVNGELFLNIATIGFDAAVVEAANRIKRVIKSHLSYTIGLVSAFFSYRNIPATVKYEGHSSQPNLLLIAVGNGRFYGGGFEICPEAKWDDGLFDVTIVHDLSKLRLLRLFPSILSATHKKHHKYVSMERSPWVEVKIDQPFVLNIDGDLREQPAGTEVHFQLEREVLNIIY